MGFANQIWLCQGLAKIPKVKCLIYDLLCLRSAETFPMAQVSLLHVPPPLPSCPTVGQGSVPGLECVVPAALEPIWQGKWQVGVLLQSSDLNLLLQPAGRAEFNEQVWLHCWKPWPQGNKLVVGFVSSWMVPGQLYCAILQILMPAQISQRYRLSRGFFSQQLSWLRPSTNTCGMPAPRKAWHSHVRCKTLWEDFLVSCNSAQILVWACSSLYSSSAQFPCAAAL